MIVTPMNPNQTGWPCILKTYVSITRLPNATASPLDDDTFSGSFSLYPPTEDDIRWQFNSAVAYGAQGILYFFFLYAPAS
jgi:hypothetical protein